MSEADIIQREVWCVLGLPFDAVCLDKAINHIRTTVTEERKCFLSTPNLNFVVAAQTDPAFFQSVVDSDLSVADGMPLIWAAKLLGIPLPQRVAGSSLFDNLSQQRHCKKKIRVFFFGGQAGIAEKAHDQLNKNSQSMVSCGFYDPGFVSVAEMSTLAIIDYINSASADFIVVALGAQKGQQWIQKNKDRLNVSVISHLGAVINFVAGYIDRAPLVWQRVGMEWLWRIWQEPQLSKRYLSDGLSLLRLLSFKVLPLAVYDRMLKRTKSYKDKCEVAVVQGEQVYINLLGSIHQIVIGQLKKQLVFVVKDCQGDVVLDCTDLSYIDSAVIATLMLFQNCLAKQGRNCQIIHVSKRIRNILFLSNTLKRLSLLY